MRFLYLLSVLALAAVSQSAAALAEGPRWTWDRDTIGLNCTLVQDIPSNFTAVSVTRGVGSDGGSLSFKVRSPKFTRGTYEGASIEFSDGTRLDSDVSVYSSEHRRYRIEASSPDPRFLNALAKSDALTVAHPDFGSHKVVVRETTAAAQALRTCEDGLLARWGVDPKAHWALASRPRPIDKLYKFFDPSDYPSVGIRRGVQSNVVAKLDVGPDGRVQSCSSPGKHDFVEFVRAACDKLKEKARFHPAIRADGKPTAAPFVVVIRWVLA